MHQFAEYLEQNKIVTDGAFGTYFSREDMLPEAANILAPNDVEKVHLGYLEAGAMFLRTNTFASNCHSLSCNEKDREKNIENAVKIARDAVKTYCEKNGEKQIFIAGDIGPILSGNILDAKEKEKEYEQICETFLSQKVDILIFETFPSLADIAPIIKIIKDKYPQTFVIVQFSVNQLGYSNAGLSAKSLLLDVIRMNQKKKYIDGAGFNCGVGPGHLYQIMKGLQFPQDIYITALPNANYPKLIQNRIVFLENTEYFSQKMIEIAKLGVDILGGCCGTNPNYIEKLKDAISDQINISGQIIRKQRLVNEDTQKNLQMPNAKSAFYKEKEGKKLIAVELSPPPNANDEKIMEAAHLLETFGVDTVTFPDSPSGRTRADSVLIASKVAKETNLCVMPHVCCRDKNAIAMRSMFLGAHVNGIKNALIITGDPVPTMVRNDIKSVFNFDSVGLMKIINEMNQDEFASDAFCFGGAINQNRLRLEVEIGRVEKKMATGATFFFTQPVFGKEDVEKLRQIKEKTGARILCGIMPLVSKKNALFIQNEMAGIVVGDEIVSRFKDQMTKEEGEEVGVSIAKEVMELSKDVVDGYYFSIPFNRVYLLKKILDL